MKMKDQTENFPVSIQIIRHAKVCEKLQISSAKLFDMVAQGQFPKPFQLVPGGRAVGWLECQVNQWVLDRKAACNKEAV
jgi:prophage regulatory protein